MSQKRYSQHLPAIYQGDALLADFLAPFEDILGGFDQLLDEIDRHFSPDLTDPEFLPWLATWVALVLDEQWDERKRRQLIDEALELYRLRGTVAGLKRYLEIYTGHEPEIREWHWPGGMQIGVASQIGAPLSASAGLATRLPRPAPLPGSSIPTAVLNFRLQEHEQRDYYVVDTRRQELNHQGQQQWRPWRLYYDTARVLAVQRYRKSGEDYVEIQRADGGVDIHHPASVTRRDGLSHSLHRFALADWTRVLTTNAADHEVRSWDRIADSAIVFSGHDDELRWAEFSADGTRLLTASADGTARIWDSADGAELLKLEGHSGPINHAAFCADGGQVVTASEDHTARVWDAADGTEVQILRAHSGPVLWAEFSPDGARVVTASADRSARLWERDGGNVLAVLEGHEDAVQAAGFAPNGERVATGSADGSVRLWDGRDGTCLAELRGSHGPVSALAFSADGGRLVTGHPSGALQIWGTVSGQPLAGLVGHAGGVRSARFSADGRHLVSAANDLSARVWDSHSGGCVHTLAGFAQGETVLAAAFAAALSEAVEWDYIGNSYLVDEVVDQPHRFVVDVHVSPDQQVTVQPDKVRAIIDLEKPAHTMYYLRITPGAFELLPLMIGVDGRSTLLGLRVTQLVIG